MKKLLGYIAVPIGIILLVVLYLAYPSLNPEPQLQGVTFSQPHATGIGLDWKEAYIATLDDLGVKRLRLVAYWNVIEPRQDNGFDFTDLDYQMDEAAERDAGVLLAIGRKVPRWPECHTPAWAEDLPEAQQQQQVLEMLEVVIERYKDHPALERWQLENEPLLAFGECPPEDRDFYAEQEQLLRTLDPTHPIVVTDSGELNSWLGAAQFGDIIGTTAYRTVFSKRTERFFSYDYIFPSWVYRLKSRYVQLLRGKSVFIAELQGEPWSNQSFVEISDEERAQSFSIDRFRELSHFARRTQLPEAYWWGVEYWYWEKEVNENPAFWEFGKTLFANES